MSDATAAVREALVAAIGLEPAVAAVPVYLADAPSGLLPRIEIAEPVATDWSAKGWRGRELRTAVTIKAASGQAGRLAAMRDAVEAAGVALAGEIDGWHVASAVYLRSRTAEQSGGVRAVLVEHRVRLSEA